MPILGPRPEIGKKSPKFFFTLTRKLGKKFPKNRHSKIGIRAIFPIFGRFFPYFPGEGEIAFFGILPGTQTRKSVHVVGSMRPIRVQISCGGGLRCQQRVCENSHWHFPIITHCFPLEPFVEINPGILCSGIDNE